MKKILNVLYQSNNNYAILTGVSIVSLFENNKGMDEINVFVLNDGISNENLKKYKEIGKKYNRNINIINTDKIIEKIKALNLQPYKGTYTTYFKLFAVNDLKIKTDRILQIDGDTIINEDLSELLTMNLTDYVCAATYDCILNDYKKLINIDPNEKYYNCGVLLINQKYWNENKCENKIVDHLTNVRNRYFTVDQDIINVLFRDKIKYLDIKYNLNSGFYIYGIKNSFKIYGLNSNNFSSIELIESALKKPYINHCMGAMTGRPWEKDNIHPQNELYDKYLEISPWKNVPKVVVKRSQLFKIQRFMYKYLPRKLYVYIHRFSLQRFYVKKNKEAIEGSDK